MLYVSNYNIPKDYSALNYSINLDENFPQSCAFSKDWSLLKFEFYFVNQKDDINIQFNLLNKGIYAIRIFVEDILKKEIKDLKKNKTINLKPNNWNTICTAQQICNLSFIVSYDNIEKTEEESYFQILIKRKGDKDEGINSNIILIVVLSIVGLIIIAAIIILLIIRKKKNQKSGLIDDIPEENEGLVV